MTDALVQLQKVSQVYGFANRQFTALEDINLTLRVGEFTALLGPSGCGKSTLLRIIAGLQKASAGTVYYRGEEQHGVNPHTSIVFQTFALFPWLTVMENITLVYKVRGIPKEEQIPKAEALLDQVGLDGFESAYPRELSGGMRQKVGFARAMAVEPELLCLDEPFSALDVLSAESLRKELLELWLGGKIPTKSILMVSHNIEEAILLADRVVIMDKKPGRIVADYRLDLPHPRDSKAAEFHAQVDHVYAILAGQTRSEVEELGVAPGEKGLTRMLPKIEIADLAGMVQFLDRAGLPRHDIYKLEDELGIESDNLLRLVEVAELLGFASIQAGDIELTSLGQAFADAGILARKEIFASRARRLPTMRWLLAMLESSENHQLKLEILRTALSLEFPPDEAEKQIDILIEWGRYSEMLAYDREGKVISLESKQEPSLMD